MNKKICVFLTILLISSFSEEIEENIRFADGPMMRKHHN